MGRPRRNSFSPNGNPARCGAFHRHHLCPDLLARRGEQDLTAHVNFSTLEQAGVGAGLATEGLPDADAIPDRHFLANPGSLTRKDSSHWTAGHTRQFQTLTHPEHLGRAFRVLVQSRLIAPPNWPAAGA